jgi:hypothetical protein
MAIRLGGNGTAVNYLKVHELQNASCNMTIARPDESLVTRGATESGSTMQFAAAVMPSRSQECHVGSFFMTLKTDSFVGNWASSSVTNGSNNGNNNGDNDGDDGNGDSNGNGVLGDVTVAGGGIFSDNMLSASYISVVANYAASTVTNGIGDGNVNGNNSTETDGQGDGNGVDGNLEVIGGGTANGGAGTLTLVSTMVVGNSVHSSPTSGSGDTTLDGQLVNGTVTVS